MRRLAWLVLVLPTAASAHAGHEHQAAPGWTLDVSITLPLALTLLLYVGGFGRLWRRAGGGRERLRRSALLFGAGWLVLAGALVSPLHEAGGRSFAMHMVEHELIMLVAALLLAASRAGPVLLWGLPERARRGWGRLVNTTVFAGSWRAVSSPAAATLLQALALWIWHAPALFDRALRHEGWHVAQHLSFVVTALLFWWAMLQADARGRWGVAATCLFVTATVGAGLGALMALSTSPWYAAYAAMGLTPWGLTPAEDQQVAGLIMWIPGGLVHLGAALLLLYRALKPGEVRHAVAG